MNEEGAPDQPVTPEPKKKEEDQEKPELPAVQQGTTSVAKAKANHLWSQAVLFSKSSLVPKHYQGQPENCYISLQMADRMGVDAMMLMQNTYVVHGKPGFLGQFVSALVNASGLFTDDLEFEIVGEDPHKPDYKVRAYATRKTTGKTIYGPWIDWLMIKGEGWDKPKKEQISKWKTLPGLMFLYRSATFFARTQCSQVLMGMQTTEEILDAEYTVTNIDRTQALKNRLEGAEPAAAIVSDPVIPAAEADPKPAKEQSEHGEPDAEEFEKYLKEKQGKLWSLCEQISGGKVVDTDKVLHEVAGSVALDTIQGENLDKAIATAEARLEKPKGKKTGELFDQ